MVVSRALRQHLFRAEHFIGLIGIESANRIVGAVTKDGQAGRLTDNVAVTKILGMTAGTFEYYEVPEKELSRLNQNLEMDISELLSHHANGGDTTENKHVAEDAQEEAVEAAPESSVDQVEPEQVESEKVEPELEHVEAEPEHIEVEPEPEPEPEHSEAISSAVEDSVPVEEAVTDAPAATEQESVTQESVAQEPATVQTEKVSTLLAKFKKEPKAPVTESKEDASAAPKAGFDKGVLDQIGTKGFDASTLDAIGTKGFDASTLDAIGTKGFDASTLDQIGTKGFDASTLDAIGTKEFDASTLDAIGTKTEPAKFDPATDALSLNAAATVERIKHMRKPDAELEAEAAKAQRMKFASRKNVDPPPADGEVGAPGAGDGDSGRMKTLRPSGPQTLPAIREPKPKIKVSPKVYMAAGGVVGLVVIFFIVRVPIGNYLVTSSEALFNKRDYKGASNTLNPVFMFDPSNTQAHFLKGKILSAQGEQAKAFEEYDTALKANPLDGELLRAHALLAWKMNKHSVLKADTDTLINNDPTAKVDGFFYGLRAKAELDLGDPKGAYDDCTAALKLGQKTPWIYARRGWALVNKGNPKAALKDFNTAIAFPKNDATADAYVGKGAALVALKDNAGALACYNAAVKINDKSAATYATRAYLYSNMNQQDKALADYATALKFDPGYTAAYIAIADIYLRQNKLDLSIKELNAVPKKYENVDLFIARGRTYQRLNNMKAAIANFKLAFSMDPKRDPYAYMDAAYCYGVLKDYTAALATLQTAIDLQPTNAEFVASHGFYNLLAGNAVRAGQDFEKALSMDPKNADAHFWRGGIFERQGDVSAAIQDYEAAVASNPDYAEAKKKLAALNHVDRHSSVSTGGSKLDTIKIIAGDYETLMKQGYAKMKAKDARGACSCFASAVQANPNSVPARRYLAYALVMKGNTFDAINQFQALESAGSADSADLRALGSLLIGAQRWADAVGVYLKLVTENPKDTDARLKLIEAYSKSGDLSKAVETCKDGQKTDPAGSARYLVMMEKLKTSGDMQEKKKGTEVAMPAG
ncbi:MAG: tetratricopeptide repeat protein [Candidatus Melainabacteria bacterium]|nr:tetratricopeptide repeat protein [Candidatus Melainabacteria bacterium]